MQREILDVPIEDGQFDSLTHWWKLEKGKKQLTSRFNTKTWSIFHLFISWLLLTLTWRFSNWFHSGFAFFSMIWVHSWRCTSGTRQGLFCFATRCVCLRLQRLCLFGEPFCQRSEPPRKDPPGSSCSPLLQTCLLSTAQTHRPLGENIGGSTNQDLFRLAAKAGLHSEVSRYWFSAACRSGEWSYSGECPRLCTPSATGWPSEESLQQAAADCSQCRRGHRSSPSSLPAKHRRDKRPVSSERQWAVGGAAFKFAWWGRGGGGEKNNRKQRKCPTEPSGLPVVPEARPQSPPRTGWLWGSLWPQSWSHLGRWAGATSSWQSGLQTGQTDTHNIHGT